MMPVTLHIGAPKTGSTFLQRWLEENRDLLAARGLHTIPLMSSHRLAVACICDAERHNRDDAVRLLKLPLDEALKQLVAGLSDATLHRSVISSEYFTNTDPSAVAAFFREHDLAIDTILCFVRRQDRAIASGFNQSVKVAGKSTIVRSIDYRTAYDWHALYKRWREAFPEATLVFRNYDQHARDNNLLEVFKQDVGYVGDGEEDRIPAVEQSNPSLNATLLDICRLANERNHKQLGRFLVNAQLHGFKGPRYGLSQDKTTQLEHLYREGNAALAQEPHCAELAELARPGWLADGIDLTGQVSPETLVDLLAFAVARLPISHTQPAHRHPQSANLIVRQPEQAPASAGAPPPPAIPMTASLVSKSRRWARRIISACLTPVFDTRYYLSTYSDVAQSGVNPWLHYWRHGRREGRMRKPDVLNFSGNASLFDPAKKTILVVLHEGSRTGAPIIGYNLVLGLLKTYNVVVLTLAPGPVAEACSLAGAYVAASRGRATRWINGDAYIQRLAKQFHFTFAIVNAFGSRIVLRKLATLQIPAIMLIHEFAGNIGSLSDFSRTVDLAAVTVFPSPLTRENALQLLPTLRGRRFPVIPQGLCVLPPEQINRQSHRQPETVDDIRDTLGLQALPDDTLIIMGVGYVSYRKGVDLFIQCASAFRRRFPNVAAHFVWVGAAYCPDTDSQYSAFLADQIRREGLDGHLSFAGEFLNMRAVYTLADLLLLTSRLDPLPNVCIEAMAAGLPMLCFDNTTGFVDVLNRHGIGKACIARYLDVEDMATKIAALAASPNQRIELAAIGRKIVAETFSMPTYVERIEQLALQATQQADAKHKVVQP